MLRETIEAAGRTALTVATHVTDEASVITAYDAAAARFGAVDTVVGSAKINLTGS